LSSIAEKKDAKRKEEEFGKKEEQKDEKNDEVKEEEEKSDKKKEKKKKAKSESESESEDEDEAPRKGRKKKDKGTKEEDPSVALYMAQGIANILHGDEDKEKKEKGEEGDSNFLERGMNFFGELVDDVKSMPDKFFGDTKAIGRADKTQVVRIVGHLDQERNGYLSPIILIDLVAAILEVPAKLITTTHEKVVALAQTPIPRLIEDLWRTVKKAIIETYFRFLGLDQEDVDVRMACDILKSYPHSEELEEELNDAGYGKFDTKAKAIEERMSKNWMCEKITATMDKDRDGHITVEEAKELVAKVGGGDEGEELDVRGLTGSTSKVASFLFKHKDRSVVEKYYDALDCGNPDPPAEAVGKFAAVIKKWNRSFLLKVRLQDMGWKKMGAQARKAALVAEEKKKAAQQKRYHAGEKKKKGR